MLVPKLSERTCHIVQDYMSPLTFEAYILFIGSVTGSLRKDSSLTTFGIENVKDAAIEQIKLGLHEEGSAKEYIDSTDLTDENINGFLRKVFFVIDDGKKPSEYVKAIIMATSEYYSRRKNT